ncbi:hypothetical protein CBR_g48514 [Chara braunii]|uniref:Ubiquinol-cytochrome c chaperone domain-containing protein n=1 Tax=Chara braunii TaxID=69332 RepID=A0A388M336_CHABU|nr:hypothetical protein CBR_g48514 [Chara braunii]|eukprot:GBG88902.1 hypothetical protein CBR_g48514 [Chara braunii]
MMMVRMRCTAKRLLPTVALAVAHGMRHSKSRATVAVFSHVSRLTSECLAATHPRRQLSVIPGQDGGNGIDDRLSDNRKTMPFTSKPRSLSIDPSSELRVETPTPQGVSGLVLRLLGYYSEHGQLVRGSRTLYGQINAQVDQQAFYTALNLPMNFRTSFSVRVLHLWLCMVRLRAEGKVGKKMSQMLYNLYNHDLEKRVVAAGVKMVISKWMKELEKNFYGACSAYDKAMQPSTGHDELAKALWRNVFAEDASEMPTGPEAAYVHALARYVRRETASLALTDSESLLSGNILFSIDFGNTERANEQSGASVDQGGENEVAAAHAS